MDEIRLVSQLLDDGEPPPQAVARGRRRLAEFSAQPRPRHRPGRRMRPCREQPVFAGGAIAAAAAVAVAVAVPLASGGATGRPVRTNTPLSHAALTAAILTALDSAADDIIWVHTGDWVSQGQSMRWDGWVWPWNPRVGQQVQVHVSYVNAPDTAQQYDILTEERPPAGSWAAESGVGIYGPSHQRVIVDYTDRTWQRMTYPPGPPGKGSPVPWVPSVATIRAEVASGDWSVVGHGNVGGHQAIELRWKKGVGPLYGPDSGTWELWVDAATYLPLKEILNETGARPQSSVTTYQFLLPTAANLATFKVVIPPGFTEQRATAGQFSRRSGIGPVFTCRQQHPHLGRVCVVTAEGARSRKP